MTQGSYGKTDLIDDLTAQTSGVTRKQIEQVMNAALDLIQQRVKAGNRVTITGFGTWQQSHRQARTGTNIRTKQKISIPAQTSVRWTPGSEFKAAVSGRSRLSTPRYAKERVAGSSRK